MNISRFAKAIAYECLTALLLVKSVLFQAAMHTEGQMEEAYVRSNVLLFLTAAVLLGVGVYSLMSYTRRHRQHVWDSVFFLVIGFAFMIAAVMTIVNFGGLEGTFTESGYTAMNVNVVLLTALPVPFWVRSVILACSTREKSVGKRIGVQAGFVVLAVAMAVLIGTGHMMKIEKYAAADGGAAAVEGFENSQAEEGDSDNV